MPNNSKYSIILTKTLYILLLIVRQSFIGASPSGKAPGFGPGISEVRVLPPQF